MQKRNLKSSALFVVISATAGLLLLSAILSIFKLPLLTPAGLASLFNLILLTFAASRFTVALTGTDGVSQSRKSVADALVFLAVMLYAIPPTGTAGPATLLAAIVGFMSTYRLSSRRESIVTTAIAVISTFISASCYGMLVRTFADNPNIGLEGGLPLNIFLIPVCVLAVLQYSLSTLATASFLRIDGGKAAVLPRRRALFGP